MPPIDTAALLKFSPPDSPEPRNSDEAERQCLGFGELYLRKSRELNEAQRTLTEVLDDMDQRLGFVIRNLLDCLENCKSLLAAQTTEQVSTIVATGEANSLTTTLERDPTTTVEQTLVEDSRTEVVEDANRLGLASVERSLIYLLEELGVRRINLIDQTYGSVVVDGRPIPDPFEVMSTTQQGKAMDRKVTQVLRDLWVDRDGRVVQKGSVIC